MTDLTPPPMSKAKLWQIYNAWRRDHECDTTFDLMQMALSARDEQWRQRMEAVAVVGDLVLTVRERAMDSGALNRDALYRIKEQG